jgi:hypothetical protein
MIDFRSLSGHLRLHKWLLRLVEECTLAQFREAGTREGGVDLLKVRAHLEPRIDELLIHRLKRGLNWFVAAGFLALLVVVSVQIYVVLLKLYAH